ncbi:MAG: hypothetical protein IIB00_06995 [candidate division Zixibacteria bacterium]|nr:hypothetical protein [candidate division Zixibacteria bacterium]
MALNDHLTWLAYNANLLSQIFGKSNIQMDITNVAYIRIRDYPLPSNWKQTNTPLLIVFDNPANIFVTAPDRFYINKGLKSICGAKPTHYYENKGFNDLSHLRWARYSFHIGSNWKPSRRLIKGTTLIDVLDALHLSMTQAGDRIE